jgi:hypothetical protein
LTFSAAVAVDCPSEPVKYVIRLQLIPKYANLSATSTPTQHVNKQLKIFNSILKHLKKKKKILEYIYLACTFTLPMRKEADLQPPELALRAGLPL